MFEHDVTRINETINMIQQTIVTTKRVDIKRDVKVMSDTYTVTSSTDTDIQNVKPSIPVVDEQMNLINETDTTQLQSTGERFFDKKHDVFHLLENIHRENRWLDCDIIDISDKHGALACVAQSLEPGHYRIVINSGTYRFNNVKNNQMMLALHVAECVFRCVLEFTNTEYTLKTLDTLLDRFHDRFIGDFEELDE